MNYAIITKTFRFESAHHLPGHSGKCARPHGHSYRLEVAVRGPIRHAPGGAKPEEWGSQATRLVALDKATALFGGDRGVFAERIGMAVQGENVLAISPAGWPGPAAGQNLFTVGLSPGEERSHPG